jgi:hypothetical protein
MEEIVSKKYSLSNADLSVYANVLVQYIIRDMSDFAEYGVTTDDTDALQAMQDAFENIPPDQNYIGLGSIAKGIRDAKRTIVLEKIKQMALRFELAFGTHASAYNQLEIIDIAMQTDAVVLLRARNLANKATDYATQLLPFGQTSAKTITFKADCQAFEDAIAAVAQANSDRRAATRDRLIAGNALYEKVVRYTGIGKVIYQSTNYAKYEDYIIYGTPGATGVPEPPSGIHFSDETTLAWTAVSEATSYGVSISYDGGTHWQSDIPTSTNSTHVPVLSTGKLYYRVRARNANGFGEYSGTFENLFGLSPVEGFAYEDGELTWNAVEFANGYDLERAEAGSGSFALIYNSGGTSYVDSIGSGSWRYRIRSSYGAVKSTWVEIDVVIS